MIRSYDNRTIEEKIRCPYKTVEVCCLNCGERLDYLPYFLFGVDRGGYWGHVQYGYHNHCPLYSDVSIRPYPITKARAA